ncbi:DUF6174 domain-containing protein [Rheinheimera baltica]|uniref:DUF6174 domain-containing protein n=1 Tax=Rheinheimera baltica TaxID=67576 RepID=UPI00273E7038|nr:DUF6174 domain-containing protein [Rheinheimera baltica]MDP5144041.1 DUF6174 domain-containing protein [Rheinheimera baltica]
MNLFDLRNPFVALIVLGSLIILIYSSWGISAVLERSRQLDQFEQYRAYWRSQNLQNYSYVVEDGCMFGSTTSANVSSGKHNFITFENQSFGGNATIEDLFNEAEKAIKEAHQLDLRFNNQYGFPEAMRVDWSKDIIDDECSYEVTEFKQNEL